MEDKRESLVFYRSFYEAIKELPLEQQGEIYNAIFSFGLDFKETELFGISKTVWTLIKPQIEANIKRYKKGVENGKKGGQYGKLGGRPVKNKPLNNPLTTPKKPSNDNVNDNDNEKEYNKPTPKKILYGQKVKLTLDEYERLCNDYGKDIVESKIEDMNAYLVNNRKKYDDCNLAIRNRLKKDGVFKKDYVRKFEDKSIDEWWKIFNAMYSDNEGSKAFRLKYGADVRKRLKNKQEEIDIAESNLLFSKK